MDFSPDTFKGKKYYIGGLQYVPDESTALCAVVHFFLDDITKLPDRKILFRTQKGAFFLVHSGEYGSDKEEVIILDEAAAFEFMDQNSSGIDTDAYDRIFGEPERG